MKRDEHGAVLLPAVLLDVPEDRVGQVPAEVDADHRVLDRVRRRRQDTRASELAHPVRAGGGAGRVAGHRRDDPRLRPAAQEPLDPAGDVVDVGRLLHAVDDGAGVAAAVAGVEDDGHAGEVGRPNRVGELRGLEAGVLLLDACGIVGRPELGRQVRDRDLDRESRPGSTRTSAIPLRSAISAAFALTSSACTRPVNRTTTAEYSASPFCSRYSAYRPSFVGGELERGAASRRTGAAAADGLPEGVRQEPSPRPGRPGRRASRGTEWPRPGAAAGSSCRCR